MVLRVGNVVNESTAPQYLEVDSGCLGGNLGEAFLPRLCLMVGFFPYKFLMFAERFHNGLWQIVLGGVFDTFLVSKGNSS